MINHCTHASRELIIRINKLSCLCIQFLIVKKKEKKKLSWLSYWKKHLNCCNTM